MNSVPRKMSVKFLNHEFFFICFFKGNRERGKEKNLYPGNEFSQATQENWNRKHYGTYKEGALSKQKTVMKDTERK